MAGTGYYANIRQKNQAASGTPASKGQSNSSNLASAFSLSPIIGNPEDGVILTPEERLEQFKELVLDGEVIGGNGINQYNRDYFQNDAPDIANLDIESLNLPSPYVPNPTSPGPGSSNADDKPAYEGTLKDISSMNQFGSGNNSLYNPSVSSKKLSEFKLGNYIPGESGGN